MSALRVATYNLYLGADLSLLFDVLDLGVLAERVREIRAQLAATRAEERLSAVAAVLAAECPDLVGLQEVARWTLVDEGRQQVVVDALPTLLAALERAGAAYDAHAVNENFGGSMPVSATEVVTLRGANAVLVRRDGPVEVLAERTAELTASMLLPTGLDGAALPVARSWGGVDLLVGGRPLRFVCTHLEAWDEGIRAAQREELLAANVGTGAPVVVVGDLNARPEELGWPEGWTDAWTTGHGDGFTCGQDPLLDNAQSLLDQRIDYVWVRDAAVTAARVAGDRPEDRSVPHGLWPSDHACVVADLDV